MAMTKQNHLRNHLLVRLSTVFVSLTLSFLAFNAISLFAQTSADGSIYGHVTDSTGAALAGVQVVAHSPAVGGSFKAVSDDQGNYRVIELPPAVDYTLEAESPGFEKFIRVGLIV